MSKKFLSGINVTGTATLNTVANAGLDTDKFLVLDAAGNIDYRTGAELKADIGADTVSRIQHEVKLGETMSIGTPVYVGVDLNSGTNMTVYKSTNATEAGSSKTLGLIASSGITNDLVQVVTEGLLAGLNTSTATKGDPVWLGVNGALLFGLANKPVAPAHMVFLGIVTRVQSNNGEIFVKVQNGFEMNEIHNYLEGSVQNNEVIVYESATSLYKPKSIPAILGYTPVPDSRTITINGTTYDLSENRAWTITTDASARSILRYVATANQTTFTISGGYTPGLTDVYRNGIKLDNETDFTATNGTTIVLTNGASVNDVIEVYRYQTAFLANNALRVITEFVATAGQTTFNVTYNSGLVDVFYNGSKLLSTEYTAGNGTSIVLNFPCNVNDTLEVHAYSYQVGAFTGQAQLNGTGFVKANGTTITYDNSTYLTTSAAASTYLTTASAASTYLTTSAAGTTYLPLSGGTLTGPLNGTGATFSGTVTGNTLSFTNGTYTGNIKFGGLDASAYAFDLVYQTNTALRFGVSGGDGPQFQGWGGTAPAFAGQMYFDFGSYTRNITGRALYFRSMTTGTAQTVLTIAANGNATFTGSITGTSATFSGTLSGTDISLTSSNYDILKWQKTSGLASNVFALSADSTGCYISDVTNTKVLLYLTENTGAATFSSSVTAAGRINSGNGGGATASLNAQQLSGDDSAIYAGGVATAGSSKGIKILAGTNTSDYALNVASYANSPILYARGDGNVGIGTSSPLSALQVSAVPSSNGDSIYQILAFDTNTATSRLGAGISFGGYYNGTTDYTTAFASIKGFKENTTNNDFAGAMSFQTRVNGGASTERMRITSSGNVGIGTGTPTDLLTLYRNGNQNNILSIYNGTSGYASNIKLIGTDDDGARYNTIGSYTNGGTTHWSIGGGSVINTMVLSTGGSERMRITSGGEVVFQNSIQLRNGQINSLSSGGGGQSMYLNFQGNGAVYAGSSYAVLYAGSDRRIKTDIVDAESTLNKILSLTPRTFRYKERPEFTNYGFIAQEVEEVMPEIVKTSEGVTMCNGEEIENQKSIESYGLAWASILVKAIQEQQAQIEELKALIAAK